MTAAARKPRDNVVPIRPAPDLDAAYRATISVHYPNSPEWTIGMRVELMALRDRASAALRRCPPDCEPALAEATRLASQYALSNTSAASLAFVRASVESLIFAADMLRRAQA